MTGKVPPRVDSHACCLEDSRMYVFGGYIPETAGYMRDVYCLDLDKLDWSLVYQSKDDKDK